MEQAGVEVVAVRIELLRLVEPLLLVEVGHRLRHLNILVVQEVVGVCLA